MGATKIEWAEASWNPVSGCTPVSAGCANCYARRMAQRLRGRCGYPADDPFRVTLHRDHLEDPLHWRQPRLVFTCSMGDLFHEQVPAEFIREVFDVMRRADRHRFLVLTKRPERMARLFPGPYSWPWHHIWPGASVENQGAVCRVSTLVLKVPAMDCFLSCEPLLGPVSISRAMLNAIRWVIIGGESGPGARPMELEWARSLVADCREAGVPVFVKQLGSAWAVKHWPCSRDRDAKGANPTHWPPDLRVREWPEGTS